MVLQKDRMLLSDFEHSKAAHISAATKPSIGRTIWTFSVGASGLEIIWVSILLHERFV